ncbi:hypothetical protein KKB10_02490 [Patescibacteria group bacterium]|nr:hypothetical protein [Patescibacteria group bacterium]MBU1952242.1 hypothetical protein [Patescibacteria group bacterium]MBU2228941.1 hypothetical protein [Patescibacteria group bacterium]
MFNKFTKLALIAIFLVGGFFITPNAQALTLIAPTFEQDVDPGIASKTEIKLYNENQDALTLYAEVVSFTAKGETGQPTFDFEAPLEGVATWFDLPEGAITLEGGERKVIPITITPPIDAEPGGHYATVFFGTSPPDINDPGSLALATKLGSLFLLRVFGDVTEEGSIAEFGLDGNETSLNRLPATLFTRFQNSGNIHLRPAGTITVKNLLGAETAKLDFNAKKGATLPDSIRKYETVWEKGQVKEVTGNFWNKFWAEFSNEKNNFALGRYKASIVLTAGTLIQDTAEVSFWVWPWRILLISLIVLVLIVFLLILSMKRYNKWIVKKARGSQQQ